MTKKIIIAVVAVVVALGVIKFTWLGSHVRLLWKQGADSLKARVPLEQEIARLEMEVKEKLKAEQERLFSEKIDRKLVVKKLSDEVADLRTSVNKDTKRVVAMRTSLENKDQYVAYEGGRFKREELKDELDRSASSLQVRMELLTSKEEELGLARKSYDEHKRLYDELLVAQTQMQNELTKLKADLAREQRLQMADKKPTTSAGLDQLKKDLANVKASIERMTVSREERGKSTSPVRDFEANKAKQEKLNNFIQSLRVEE